MSKIAIIVPGWLNTDIIGVGVERLVGKGEYSRGTELKIGPGGKSRNIAEMIAVLNGGERVAMIAKTVNDPLGLWRYPVDALREAGVDTSFIQVEDYKKVKKFPGVALIPVDKKGNNQIYVLPGISQELSSADVLSRERIFKKAEKNNGMLVQTLEIATKTAEKAFVLANKHRLRIAFDPGGIRKRSDLGSLLKHDIYLLKPNEHETEILTGVKITNFNSAKRAAGRLLSGNVKNLLITHGKNGAYLFNSKIEMHVEIPKIKLTTTTHDETGCGDQTMATLCAELSNGVELEKAVETAILSGTLQFRKQGIQPITKEELLSAI